MIIRSIELHHWRGLPHFACEFDDGLNLLCGLNEAGKSTVVEALHWALFQDIVGSGRIKADIEAIIPAYAPRELPTVNVLLSFPTCTVSLTKRLSTSAAARECRLVVQRGDSADEHFEQSRAQEMLWQLMSNDGNAAAPQGLAPDGEIIFSKQGKGTFYVENDLSGMVRSALSANPAIDTIGDISLSPRLETVRARLQKLRHDQLGKRLAAQAVDAARKQSQVAVLRDRLKTLEAERATQLDLLQSLEANSQRAEDLAESLKTQRERSVQLSHELQVKTALCQRQQEADNEVLQKTGACNSLQAARDQLQNGVDQIARHSETVAMAQRRIQTNESLHRAAREKLAALQSAVREAEIQREKCQQTQREKLRAADAWRSWLEVKERQTAKNHAQRAYDNLRELAQNWQKAQSEMPAGDKLLQVSRLSNWRERFRDIEAQEHRLAHQIRFDLKWEKPVTITWRTDGQAEECVELPGGTPFTLRGKSTFDLNLHGEGRIKVRSREDKSAQHSERDIVAKRQNLQREMTRYGCDDVELPAGFELLEERAAAHQEREKAVQEARAAWIGAVRGCKFLENPGSLDDHRRILTDVYQYVQEQTALWEEAKEEAAPYKAYYPEQVTVATATRERRVAMRERQQWEEAAIAAEKDYQQKSAQFHQEKEQTDRIENELRSDREKIDHAEAELLRLREDGRSDTERKEHLKQLTDQWILADAALKTATAARRELGEAITPVEIAVLQEKLQSGQEKIAKAESELSACRAHISYQCENDPQNVLEEIEFERAELTSKLQHEEARLRGMVLLQAAIETQRLRFGNSIAAPLNAQLSPWISRLRGKTTHVEFDPAGKRLVGVRTDDEHGHYQLNFEAHSGGMQEQTALLIRLIYLQLASKQLPGQRLPAILDDPLTHTDKVRREGLISVLQEAAETLQIIYVSCHEEHLGALPQARRIYVKPAPRPGAQGFYPRKSNAGRMPALPDTES